jgi:hypothetical protein
MPETTVRRRSRSVQSLTPDRSSSLALCFGVAWKMVPPLPENSTLPWWWVFRTMKTIAVTEAARRRVRHAEVPLVDLGVIAGGADGAERPCVFEPERLAEAAFSRHEAAHVGLAGRQGLGRGPRLESQEDRSREPSTWEVLTIAATGRTVGFPLEDLLSVGCESWGRSCRSSGDEV